MNFKVPSKICLSLKEIDFENLEIYQKISNLIEIRLDFISLTSYDLVKLCNLFDYVILKSNNIEDYYNYKLSNIYDNYSNFFLDIDYNIIVNQEYNEILMNLSSTNPIISLHNISLIEFEKKINEIIANTMKFEPKMYKFVIKDDRMEVNTEELRSLYNLVNNHLNNPNIDVIIFFEGEKYTNTRYFSISYGAPFIYCSFDDVSKTGKGQPTFAEARVFFDSVST